ncbi:SDR family NAD(P)-dependent oxidoreductase [Nocardia puris]|uniref:Ketoreductase domain-containing protein n=2 Tax=Nocardia puris TaxID=208602 RepID=A0A366E421_9NOCA|nr:SDR family NAD(P)-dependent oxidoreductase [Nocardia puris]MBF6216092.1 SDR family NAD(P)-dependent oxidoreductase [Nocardia puris]MBF6368895.1 SDR family NAD(P)-dependent oxidoreductase [Nocardia puris]MBF6462476.1 SDR family NAD(P)-dependent oxidoreductase [Nocardia puris]RBO97057.1 hypothetical protein DFR74_1011076 [Nocardia puris]
MTLPPPASDATAVVTGSSSGIGAAIARALAARGHHVSLVARRADRLADLADRIRAEGGAADAVPADLTDPAQRAALPDRVAALGRTPSILVNNAGTSIIGPAVEYDPARQLAVIEVDAVAVADLCVGFVPGMVARGRGAVLTVSSTAAFQPMPGQAAYSAAKAFALTYTQALAAELRGTGVTATVLCPGPVATEIGVLAGMTQEEFERSMPAPFWLSAEQVAESGIDAADKGKLLVVPGAPNRALGVFGRLAPRAWLLRQLATASPAMRSRPRTASEYATKGI